MGDSIERTTHILSSEDAERPSWDQTAALLSEMLDTMDAETLDMALEICPDILGAVIQGLQKKEDYESLLGCLNYVTAIVAERAKREPENSNPAPPPS